MFLIVGCSDTSEALEILRALGRHHYEIVGVVDVEREVRAEASALEISYAVANLIPDVVDLSDGFFSVAPWLIFKPEVPRKILCRSHRVVSRRYDNRQSPRWRHGRWRSKT